MKHVQREGCYLGVRFAVHLSPELKLGELDGFLDSHFAACAPGPAPGWTIRVIPETDSPLSVGRGISLWTEPSGTVTLTDWDYRIRYHSVPKRADGWLVIQDVYCGIRRLAMITHGACAMLHAACVKIRGRVILLLGEKASGKGVAMHRLIMQHGACYIAGDKVCVWLDRQGVPACSGLISAVRIRLADQSLLADAPAHASAFARATELASGPSRLLGDKVCLAPAEYCHLTRTAALPLARPGVLILLGGGTAAHHRIDDASPVAAAEPETRRLSAVLNSENADRVLEVLTGVCSSHACDRRPDSAALKALIDSSASSSE